MYSVTNEAVASAIESLSPVYRIWLEDTETGEIFTGEKLFNAKKENEATTLSDDIELGAVCTGQFNATVLNEGNEFLGREYNVYIYLKKSGNTETTYGDLSAYTYAQLAKMTVAQVESLGEILEGEKIPMGTFTCVRCKRQGLSADLLMYDKLYFAGKDYTPKITLPATSKAIENDICAQLGIVNGNSYTVSAKLKDNGGARLYSSGGVRLRTGNFDFKISTIPNGTTMRQMLSYIASAHGQFGCVDRFGRYVRKWYGNSVKTLDNNTIDLPTLSEQSNKIVGIICKVSDSQTLTQGVTTGSSGRILEIENPYMTTALLTSLFANIRKLEWHTATVFQRLGDPRLDIGDVVTYGEGENRYNIPITSLSFTFDGGLSADISAVGISTEEQIEI